MKLGKAASITVRSLTPARPYHVQWMLTRKCNYCCKGCNVWREQDAKELSTEQVKKGLDILRDLGTVDLVLSGGNPLLREDIGEIIEYASRFFITTVYDNGSMAAQKIDALRNADFVAISIDSLDPKKNDYVKGVSGAWEKAMLAVKKLQKEGISVGVTPTISQLNLNEIVDMTNWFVGRKIPVWYSLYSFDSSEGGHQLFKIGKQNDEFIITDKENMVSLCDSLMSLKKRSSLVLVTDRLLYAVRALYAENRRTWKCLALQNFLIVDHLGKVAGCHLCEPVSSIYDLPKAWNSEQFNCLRKNYSNCTRCTYLCYIFYSVHGTVLGNLQIARERWRSAPLLLKKKQVKSPNLARQK